MKKTLFIILSTLFFIQSSFAEEVNSAAEAAGTFVSSAPTEQDKKMAETIALGNGLAIQSAKIQEENNQTPYAIDITYPQLTGDKLSPEANEFNRLVLEMAHEKMQQFKNYVKADMSHMQTLPASVRHNHLTIDYDIDVIKPEKQTLISVRLNIEGMQAGRAHPYHMHQVLNFNLTEGKALTLKDLFKPQANYLNVFAKTANQTLSKKLQDKWMIEQGTAPNVKNYPLWNLSSDEILITFEEYQVGPYVEGPQEVSIPYSALKNMLSPKTPLNSCAENPNGCVV